MKNINWWMIFSFVLAVLWGFREGCGCRKGTGDVVGGPAPEPVYLPGVEKVIIDTQYVPEPKKRVPGQAEKGTRITDTVEVPVIVEVDNPSQSSKNCEDVAYYRDSLPVSHGYAIIQDTVSENRITGRGFRLNQELPVVRETVAEKKRNVVYLGLNAQGSKQNFLFSIGADVSLKAKNDRIYSVGVGVTKDNQLLYGLGFRWPVRLRRN